MFINTLEYKGALIKYAVAGSGKSKLLYFHGFGQNKNAFPMMAADFENVFTLYAFDLFFHGESQWPNSDKALQPEEWRSIMQLFFEKEGVDRFSLAAFSIGARCALDIALQFPEKTTALTLLAPDGLQVNFWYALATKTRLGRFLFRKIMLEKPAALLFLIEMLAKTKLIGPKTAQFALHELKNRQQREKVYNTWLVYRQLLHPAASIISCLQKHHIPLTLVSGKNDKIIRTGAIERFAKKTGRAKHIVLNCSHNQVPALYIKTYKVF